jgi:hypothetical protein
MGRGGGKGGILEMLKSFLLSRDKDHLFNEQKNVHQTFYQKVLFMPLLTP